jgi:predicted lipoprotein with Yx(FWY)xxD motif
MRSTPTHPHVGRLVALFGALVLVAACTEAGGGVRSPAATGSLAPATSAAASSAPVVSAASSPAASTGGEGYSKGDYGSRATASAEASSAGAGSYVVKAASGSVGAYLTGEDGRTLYTFKPDSANTSTCTGGCAGSWPPFVVGAGDTLTAGSGVSGKLTTFARTDGSMQVAYNGAPLYYFASDAKAGDTNGQGVGGKWFVAAP